MLVCKRLSGKWHHHLNVFNLQHVYKFDDQFSVKCSFIKIEYLTFNFKNLFCFTLIKRFNWEVQFYVSFFLVHSQFQFQFQFLISLFFLIFLCSTFFLFYPDILSIDICWTERTELTSFILILFSFLFKHFVKWGFNDVR